MNRSLIAALALSGLLTAATGSQAGMLISAASSDIDAPARSGGANAATGFAASVGSDATNFPSGEKVYVAATMSVASAADFTTIDDDGESLRATTRIGFRNTGATNQSNLDFGFVSTDGGATVSLFVGGTVLPTAFSYGTDFTFLIEVTSNGDWTNHPIAYAINPASTSDPLTAGGNTSGNSGAGDGIFVHEVRTGYQFPATWGDGSGTTDVNAAVRDIQVADDINDITLNVIPEPASLVVLAAGSLLMLPRRRRAG